MVIGDLAFVISKSSRKEEGNNNKEFETGQVLEFSDAPLKSLNPMLVNQTTQTQHNINRLDYTTLGIADDEQQLIADTSLLVHKNLSDQLNLVKQQRADAEQQVITNQKIINDINRTINALEIIQNSNVETDSDVDILIQKLKNKYDDVLILINQNTENANVLAEKAIILVDEIRALGIVLA